MTNLSLQLEVENYVKEHKVLKKDFAHKIGISPVKLSHWLSGRTLLNRIVCEKIIAELDGN